MRMPTVVYAIAIFTLRSYWAFIRAYTPHHQRIARSARPAALQSQSTTSAKRRTCRKLLSSWFYSWFQPATSMMLSASAATNTSFSLKKKYNISLHLSLFSHFSLKLFLPTTEL